MLHDEIKPERPERSLRASHQCDQNGWQRSDDRPCQRNELEQASEETKRQRG